LSRVLDAGALIAVERGDRETAAVIEVARQENQAVIVPAGVVGQVWRGEDAKWDWPDSSTPAR
jgi:hypothetical protein